MPSVKRKRGIDIYNHCLNESEGTVHQTKKMRMPCDVSDHVALVKKNDELKVKNDSKFKKIAENRFRRNRRKKNKKMNSNDMMTLNDCRGFSWKVTPINPSENSILTNCTSYSSVKNGLINSDLLNGKTSRLVDFNERVNIVEKKSWKLWDAISDNLNKSSKKTSETFYNNTQNGNERNMKRKSTNRSKLDISDSQLNNGMYNCQTVGNERLVLNQSKKQFSEEHSAERGIMVQSGLCSILSGREKVIERKNTLFQLKENEIHYEAMVWNRNKSCGQVSINSIRHNQQEEVNLHKETSAKTTRKRVRTKQKLRILNSKSFYDTNEYEGTGDEKDRREGNAAIFEHKVSNSQEVKARTDITVNCQQKEDFHKETNVEVVKKRLQRRRKKKQLKKKKTTSEYNVSKEGRLGDEIKPTEEKLEISEWYKEHIQGDEESSKEQLSENTEKMSDQLQKKNEILQNSVVVKEAKGASSDQNKGDGGGRGKNKLKRLIIKSNGEEEKENEVHVNDQIVNQEDCSKEQEEESEFIDDSDSFIDDSDGMSISEDERNDEKGSDIGDDEDGSDNEDNEEGSEEEDDDYDDDDGKDGDEDIEDIPVGSKRNKIALEFLDIEAEEGEETEDDDFINDDEEEGDTGNEDNSEDSEDSEITSAEQFLDNEVVEDFQFVRKKKRAFVIDSEEEEEEEKIEDTKLIDSESLEKTMHIMKKLTRIMTVSQFESKAVNKKNKNEDGEKIVMEEIAVNTSTDQSTNFTECESEKKLIQGIKEILGNDKTPKSEKVKRKKNVMALERDYVSESECIDLKKRGKR